MEIIRKSFTKDYVEYRHFYLHYRPKWICATFSFPCDTDGALIQPFETHMMEENYNKYIANNRNAKDMGVHCYKRSYKYPSIGKCSCGNEVELLWSTNTCACGMDYNLLGSPLSHTTNGVMECLADPQ